MARLKGAEARFLFRETVPRRRGPSTGSACRRDLVVVVQSELILGCLGLEDMAIAKTQRHISTKLTTQIFPEFILNDDHKQEGHSTVSNGIKLDLTAENYLNF